MCGVLRTVKRLFLLAYEACSALCKRTGVNADSLVVHCPHSELVYAYSRSRC